MTFGSVTTWYVYLSIGELLLQFLFYLWASFKDSFDLFSESLLVLNFLRIKLQSPFTFSLAGKSLVISCRDCHRRWADGS